jgi:dipeptidyl aminopeptidase/acylaminoacyl peptidase
MIRVLPPIRAAARTATFLLKVLPMFPSKPLDWVTGSPVVERVRYPTIHGEAEGDLYRPSTPGPHPGIVMCLGVIPFDVDHPQVPRLGEALARSGFVALLYWSPAMRDLRLDPGDVESIAMAYLWLIEQPYVDPARSGLLGTCVGGSFVLMAAASRSIREHVAFIGAFAPYSSMWTFAQEIASRTRTCGDVRKPWDVDPLTRKVYVRSLTSVLKLAEAERLRIAFSDNCGSIDQRDLSRDGQSVYPLLTKLDANEVEETLRRLPAAMQEHLASMSPVNYLDDIRAPLIVLCHDRDDRVIPLEESQRLSSALSKRTGVHYTEFVMFKHMDPSKVKLAVVPLVRELVRFYFAMYPVFRQAAMG